MTWTYSLVMPDRYSDITAFSGPAVNLQIQLLDPHDGIDFIVECDHMTHVPDSHTWDFKRAFIQGQHVRVWWFAKDGK